MKAPPVAADPSPCGCAEAAVRRLETLAQALGTAPDVTSIFRALREFAEQSVPCDGIFVSLVDWGSGLRRCVYAGEDGRDEDVSALPLLPLNDSPNSRAITTGQVIITDDFTAATASVPTIDVGQSDEPRSALSMPLIVLGEVIGAFEVQSSLPAAYLPEHIPPMQIAANLAAIAVRNMQLLECERQQRKIAQTSEARYRELFDITPDVIGTFDEHGVITSLNPAFERVTGFKRTDRLGKQFGGLIHPDDLPLAREMLAAALRGEFPRPFEARALSASGDYLVGEFTIVPRIVDGRVVGGFAIARDVTARQRSEDLVRYMAFHDKTTGLPNRASFKQELAQRMSEAGRGQSLLVLLADLDGFKVVNDTVGHAGGDEVLRRLAARLQDLIGDGAFIARYGGDELAAFVPAPGDVQAVVALAERVVNGFREAVSLGDHEFYITVSLGLAIFPDDGGDADTLINAADTAMYRAKEQGGNGYALHSPALRAESERRFTLSVELRQALARQELVLYYQPQADLQTNLVTGVEALLRWQHPRRGLLVPADFIDYAEDSGLIVPIGEWVLQEASRQIAAWEAEGVRPVQIAINMSPRQIQDESLPRRVERVLAEAGISADRLQIEVTESSAIVDREAAAGVLNALRTMGVSLALDDFGTGYSSLGYLRELPIDCVKLDRSIIQSLSFGDATVARALVDICHSLSLRVIAEGVETMRQLALLQKAGCDEYQGFLLSKPVPALVVRKLLADAA